MNHSTKEVDFNSFLSKLDKSKKSLCFIDSVLHLKKVQQIQTFSNSEILFLSILLMDFKDNHEYFSHKYKVSNKINENLILLGNKFKETKADKEFFKKNLKINLYEIGLKNMKILYCLLLLEKNKISDKEIISFQSLDKISIPEFPLDGKLLIKKGIQEGKKIGSILSEAKKIWVKNDFYLSSDDLEKIIKKNTVSN